MQTKEEPRMIRVLESVSLIETETLSKVEGVAQLLTGAYNFKAYRVGDIIRIDLKKQEE